MSYPVQARDEDSDRLLDAGAESDVLSGPDEDEERNHKGAGTFIILRRPQFWEKCASLLH